MPLLIVAYYERWSGKLAELLARNASVQSTPIIADTPSEKYQPLRPYLFKGFSRQPQYGWTPAGDVTPIIAADTPLSWVAIRPWSRWLPQPQCGWVPATDLPATPTPDAPPSVSTVRPWPRGFVLQPWYGWSQAGDQDQAPAPLTSIVLPWRRTFALVPQLGWASALEVPVVVAADTPPGTWLYPFLFREYRRQAFLGQSWAWDASAVPQVCPVIIND